MKLQIQTIWLLFILISFGTSAQIPTDHLVGHWPFDNNYDDVSGNGNHGNAVATSFTYDRFNNPNSCVEFDGLTSIIRVPHDDSLNLAGDFNSYTVSLWCQSEDPIISGAVSARLIEKWNSSGSTPYPISILVDGDDIKGSVYDMNGTSQPYMYDVFGDQWLNVVFVNDYDLDSVSIYLNGELIDRVENTSMVNTANTRNIMFGNNHFENRPFAGLMDDIRIYSRVLTDEEIYSIFINDTSTIDTSGNDTLFVQHIGETELTLYPNPCTDQLVINTHQDVSSIMIFNELGKLEEQLTGRHVVDMSSMPRGLYFVKITFDKEIVVRKLIKM